MNSPSADDHRIPPIDIRATPVCSVLALMVFINWFICGIVAVFLGGDALDTLPSEEGFVVSSHGVTTEVTESVWVISLTYSYLTIGFTPMLLSMYFMHNLLRNAAPLVRRSAVALSCFPGIAWLLLISCGALSAFRSYMAM